MISKKNEKEKKKVYRVYYNQGHMTDYCRNKQKKLTCVKLGRKKKKIIYPSKVLAQINKETRGDLPTHYNPS